MNILKKHNRRKRPDTGEHWISISDVMACLMMVFLFIAIVYMMQTREIAKDYVDIKRIIYDRLKSEFNLRELQEWKAEIIEKNLSIYFFDPDVQFTAGSTQLTPGFRHILQNFFPRFLKVLHSQELSPHILEVRIEGHTSSEWNNQLLPPNEKYLRNLDLSQRRAYATTAFLLGFGKNMDRVPFGRESHRDWLRTRFASIGFSSAQLTFRDDGTEDKERSRRVQFRILTDAEKSINQILSRLS